MKHSFLRINTLSAVLLAMTAQVMAQEPTPPYLDDNQPIEVRVEDALSRMTLKEKIAIIHAQSKFSSPGCPRLGIPELWMSDGPHGVRMEQLGSCRLDQRFLYGISGTDLSGGHVQSRIGIQIWQRHRPRSPLSGKRRHTRAGGQYLPHAAERTQL